MAKQNRRGAGSLPHGTEVLGQRLLADMSPPRVPFPFQPVEERQEVTLCSG